MLLIILSKNRPPQLDLLLRSLIEQVPDAKQFEIVVLYDYDNADYKNGYDRTFEEHPFVRAELQEKVALKAQFCRLLESSRQPLFAFFADDLVVIRPFSLSDRPFQLLRSRPDLAAVSLRLNPRVDYSQPIDVHVTPPKLDDDLTWKWKALPLPGAWDERYRKLFGKANGDWSLPYILDGNVYRREEMAAYFRKLPPIPRIPLLEPLMSQHLPSAPRMVCYPESHIVSLAMNTNDREHGYPAGTSSLEEMNARYLRGDRLSYTPWVDMDNRSCHYVIDPVWNTRDPDRRA